MSLTIIAALLAGSQPDPATAEAESQLAAAWQSMRTSHPAADPDKLLTGAIKGMLATLGPHNALVFLPTSGTAGIGLTYKISAGLPTLIATEPDTPAARAGLAAGDAILSIDGRPMTGMALDDVAAALRGDAGTSISLQVLKAGIGTPVAITLVREIIVLKTLHTSIQGRVALIRLSSFGRNAESQMKMAIKDLDRRIPGGAIGFVLDLRNNSGGLYDQAIAVADVFMDGGVVTTQRGRESRDVATYHARGGDLAKGRPVAVLVNHKSAAAAEIVAAALQDNKRGKIVGTPTYGKGTIETLFRVSTTSALKLTTSRVFRPSGVGIQWRGVVPDIVVPSPPLEDKILRERDLPNSVADPDAAPVPLPPPGPADGIDHQLQAAVAVVGA